MISYQPAKERNPSTGRKYATPPAQAIRTKGLTKVYRDTPGRLPQPALVDFDITIPRGTLFGLLGPNGAGKSTFINILAGLVVKTSGTAHIWGLDIDDAPRQTRAAIGVVPQELNIDPFFTPAELLELQAGMYGVPKPERRTREILTALHLADKADAYARTLSGGMRRRLLMAKALVHSPPILVLDEPTAGVDVGLRHQLWDHVRELNSQGVTILLTTHYLEEAEQLCDRIAIINRGRLVCCEETSALLHRLDRKELAITVQQDLDGVPSTLTHFDVEIRLPRRIVVRYRTSETQTSEILAAVHDAGLAIADLTTEESDLEDIFLQLTRSADEGGESPS